jgi:hypothetical protein
MTTLTPASAILAWVRNPSRGVAGAPVAKCRDCGVELRAPRKLMQCYPCHKEQVRKWRAGMGMLPTKDFPGVDIDAIHRKWPRC